MRPIQSWPNSKAGRKTNGKSQEIATLKSVYIAYRNSSNLARYAVRTLSIEITGRAVLLRLLYKSISALCALNAYDRFWCCPNSDTQGRKLGHWLFAGAARAAQGDRRGHEIWSDVAEAVEKFQRDKSGTLRHRLRKSLRTVPRATKN